MLIRLRHLRKGTENPSNTATSIPGIRRISWGTTQRCLAEAGLHARRPYRGPMLTQHFLLRRVDGRRGSVTMWAGIATNRRTHLVTINGSLNAESYRNEILTPHVLPFIAANGAMFQQDNARLHVVRANMDFLHQNNVDVLPGLPFHHILIFLCFRHSRCNFRHVHMYCITK